MERYDVVVIGGGPAGLDAGFRLVKAGKSVCIINDRRERLGGVCLSMGCMPTKSFLKAASVYRYSKKGGMFGLETSVGPVDLAKVKKSVFEGIAKLRSGVTMMSENSGAHIIFGLGSLVSANEVLITKQDGTAESVYGDKIIIAAGSSSREIPFAPFDGEIIMNSDMMLDNERLPEKLLVIGGGAIGCEFATLYNTFGSSVKVVEAFDQLIPNEDRDAAEMIKSRFEAEGIEIVLSTLVEKIEKVDGKAHVAFKNGGTEVFDMVLVSVGRKPNTDIGLDKVGVEMEGDAVKVNGYLQTSVDNIYAAGDSIGGWMFAHTAAYEGEVVAANVLNGNSVQIDERAVPRVVFSYPELASTGITKAGEGVREIYTPGLMKGRPITDKTDVGLFKLFVNENNEIVGSVLVGECATEIIHELVMAVHNRLTLVQLKETMHAHPTFAEPLSYLAALGM